MISSADALSRIVELTPKQLSVGAKTKETKMKTETATTTDARESTVPTKKEITTLKAKRRSQIDRAIDRAAKKNAKAKVTKKAKASKKHNVHNGAVRKGKLGSLLGHSVISVMRAMGKHKWTFDQAKAAVDKAKIKAADHTIRRALVRGQRGQLRIAPLTSKQLATLR
jgi:hypothetical protein